MAITVLLVDDDPNILDTATDILEEAGFVIVTASHGAAARQQLQSTPCDVAILDFNLPDTTGDVLAGELRSIRSGIKIILMTGQQDLQLVDQAKRAVDLLLLKPVDPPILAQSITRLFEN